MKNKKKIDYNLSFKGKTVLVTGSSRGIGFKISEDFKYLGAKVIGLSSKDLFCNYFPFFRLNYLECSK